MDTIRLYETDGLLTEFEAAVVGVLKTDDGRWKAALDRTAFFPEGGGQGCDTGQLVSEGGAAAEVTDVQTEDGTIWHYTDRELTLNDKVRGIIDREQRLVRMQVHGAEHLLSGIFHRLYGYDNVGFHISGTQAVLDVSGPLTDEQIRDAERRANLAVLDDIKITVSFPSAAEAMGMDYRSKLDTYEGIRLVTIEGYDVCACCAPHLPTTGMFGAVKILDHMPHRGGMRLTMTAGISAYMDYACLHDSNAKIMAMTSSKREETADAVGDLMGRMALLREENTLLRRQMTELVTERELESLKGKEASGRPHLIFVRSLDPKGLRDLVNKCTASYPGTVCAFLETQNGYRYIFAASAGTAADVRELTNDFNEHCSGRGGGSALMTEGTANAEREGIEAFFGSFAG
ncbi:MAG: hypothetical protein K6G58_08965 [Lachnospiraceae bacterium]|nr:hypothetical protein [Lachnospiraceae bacterium]